MFQMILDWSFPLLFAVVLVALWSYCYNHGHFRWNAFLSFGLAIIAFAIGEGYYLTTGKLPWCFGLEKEFAVRGDAAAAYFLIIVTAVTWYLTSWLLPKIAAKWGTIKWLPGKITGKTVSAIGLALLLFVCVETSANLCKAKGFTWGMNLAQVGGNIGADAANLAKDENAQMQKRSSELKSHANHND